MATTCACKPLSDIQHIERSLNNNWSRNRHQICMKLILANSMEYFRVYWSWDGYTYYWVSVWIVQDFSVLLWTLLWFILKFWSNFCIIFKQYHTVDIYVLSELESEILVYFYSLTPRKQTFGDYTVFVTVTQTFGA